MQVYTHLSSVFSSCKATNELRGKHIPGKLFYYICQGGGLNNL